MNFNQIAVILPIYDEDKKKEEARLKLYISHPSINRIDGNNNIDDNKINRDFLKNVLRINSTRHPFHLKCAGKKVRIPLPKGLAVRDFLFQRKEELEKFAIITLIDGTGKIDYSAIEKIKGEFEKDNTLQVVFGDRGKGEWGISEERKEIERFENYVIKKGLEEKSITITKDLLRDNELKDCQCGCWSFRTEHLELFMEKLSAYAYDIEINIFIIAVLNGLKSKFVEVDIASLNNKKTIKQLERAINGLKEKEEITLENVYKLIESASLLKENKSTKFVFKNNLEKLVYICGQLEIKSEKLAAYMTDYFDEKKEIFDNNPNLQNYQEMISDHFNLKPQNLTVYIKSSA